MEMDWNSLAHRALFIVAGMAALIVALKLYARSLNTSRQVERAEATHGETRLKLLLSPGSLFVLLAMALVGAGILKPMSYNAATDETQIYRTRASEITFADGTKITVAPTCEDCGSSNVEVTQRTHISTSGKLGGGLQLDVITCQDCDSVTTLPAGLYFAPAAPSPRPDSVNAGK